MPDLKLGLAAGKNGFFDPTTNFYLSKDKPVQTLTYADHASLGKITHALLASVPALVLYEGQLPQEAVDAWKSKFDKAFRAPTTRNIVEKGKVIGQAPINYVLNPSIQNGGRPIEGNRAFDRTDKVEVEIVVAPVEEGVGEGFEQFSAQSAPIEEAPVEEVVEETPAVMEEAPAEEEVVEKKKVKTSNKKAK